MSRSKQRKPQHEKKRSSHGRRGAEGGATHSGAPGAFYGAGPIFGLLQPKLRVNKPGDAYEREADTFAEHVTRGERTPAVTPVGSGSAQRAAAAKPVTEEVAQDDPTVMQRKEKGVDTAKADEEEDKPVQRQAAEEEESVQRQANAEEEEPVQRQAEPQEEEQVQRQAEPQEEEPVQASSDGPSSMSSAAARAVRNKGAGRPMHTPTRSRLESSTGRDLSSVRVHDGPADQQAAGDLNARAFTHGSDIWLGKGESQSDVQLMAHETAHVLQQNQGVHRQIIQRAETGTGGSNTGTGSSTATQDGESAGAVALTAADMPEETGKPDGDTRESTTTITFSSVAVPNFKTEGHRGTLYSGRPRISRTANYGRVIDTGQRNMWRGNTTAKTAIRDALQAKLSNERAPEDVPSSGPAVFKGPLNNQYFVGDLDTLAEELTIPDWGGTNRVAYKFFHVDHVVELQLADWDGSGTEFANTLRNMELLEGGINTGSGTTIDSNIRAKAREFVTASRGQWGDYDTVMREFDLEFKRVTGGGRNVNRQDYWTREEIESARHIEKVEATSRDNLTKPGKVRIYPGQTGGIGKDFSWQDEAAQETALSDSDDSTWLDPFIITFKKFNTAEGVEEDTDFGYLKIHIPEGNRTWKAVTERSEPITRMSGMRFAGVLNKASVRRTAQQLEVKGGSPIRVMNFDITPNQGLAMTGIIDTTIPLFRGATIDFALSEGNLTFSKTFSKEEFQLPGPINITETTLTIFASTRGGGELGFRGRADFAIERVGTGYLEGEASSSGGWVFAGGFEFDTETFDTARMSLRNDNGVWSGEGDLSVPDGKLAGVRRATAHVAVNDGVWSFDGSLEPKIRGVQQGTLNGSYSEENGLELGARLEFTDEIPAVQSGHLEAKIAQREDGSGYKFSGNGNALLDLGGGVTQTVDAEYDDGLYKIESTIAYERGRLSGSVTAGVTNRQVDPESGEVTGDPGEGLTAYGGGQLTIRFTDWLQGTVGVKLLPNGEVELMGQVAIPDKIDVFPERKLEREIFSVNLDLPIVGFAVAGQRVGIFATIGGGLTAKAGIGPGELRELNLTVVYNPDREDEASISGTGTFGVPFFGGLRFFLTGGLGAGIPVVSATLGLEIGAMLGISGDISATANVNWTPTEGITIGAEARLSAQPEFLFDVTGFAKVEADLWVTTIELYEKRWQLASLRLGSGLEVLLAIPIEKRNSEPVNFDWNNVTFTYPEIEPMSYLRQLVGRFV